MRSTIWPFDSSKTRTELGYAHKNRVAAGEAAEIAARRQTSFISLWKDQVQIAPILGGRGALARPIRIIVQMIGNLGGPETGDVAIVDIAFDWLAQPRGSSGRIHFPARRKR